MCWCWDRSSVCFSIFFGGELNGMHVLGVDLLGFVFNLAGANLRHSHIWLSYGPRLEKFFISPAQHQIHHSEDPQHFDRNYGSFLAIWDRLGNSLYVPKEHELLDFGLSEDELNHEHGLIPIIWQPFKASMKRLFKIKS